MIFCKLMFLEYKSKHSLQETKPAKQERKDSLAGTFEQLSDYGILPYLTASTCFIVGQDALK